MPSRHLRPCQCVYMYFSKATETHLYQWYWEPFHAIFVDRHLQCVLSWPTILCFLSFFFLRLFHFLHALSNQVSIIWMSIFHISRSSQHSSFSRHPLQSCGRWLQRDRLDNCATTIWQNYVSITTYSTHKARKYYTMMVSFIFLALKG